MHKVVLYIRLAIYYAAKYVQTMQHIVARYLSVSVSYVSFQQNSAQVLIIHVYTSDTPI